MSKKKKEVRAFPLEMPSTEAAKGKTILVNFVLDETGSMMSCLDATINGFNEYVGTLKEKQKKGEGTYLLTLTQWDSERFQVIHNMTPIEKVKPLTKESYQPGASTPLYDAIAKTIVAVDGKTNEDREGKIGVLTVIMTDGEENASKEYTREAVKALIAEKEKQGWTFLFLSAGLDAKKTAVSMGVNINNAMHYDTHKTTAALRSMGMATALYASNVEVGNTANMDAAMCMVQKAYEEAPDDNVIQSLASGGTSIPKVKSNLKSKSSK